MTTLTPNELLKYARVQMAAEALYSYDPRDSTVILQPGALRSGVIRTDWLTTGNGHASHFTETDASSGCLAVRVGL